MAGKNTKEISRCCKADIQRGGKNLDNLKKICKKCGKRCTVIIQEIETNG